MWWPVAKWVAVGAAVIFIVQMLRDDGAQSLKNKMERQDNEAAHNADTARLDYDGCSDAGLVWDFGAGKCRGPSERGRD